MKKIHLAAVLLIFMITYANLKDDLVTLTHSLNLLETTLEKIRIPTPKILHKNPPFVLITSLYNEKNTQRREEYITCLQKNLAHPLISHVHVLYDITQDDEESYLSSHLNLNNVLAEPIIGRPSFAQCFEQANNHYYDRIIILANADIYFNETLEHLVDYDFEKKFICLTRWNVQKDGSLILHGRSGKPFSFSQDTWLFKTPIEQVEADAILLGTPACDARIAYQAEKSGLTLVNPCLSVQCCHMQLSGIRHYSKKPPNKNCKRKLVPGEKL